MSTRALTETKGTRHPERELKKHEQRDCWEDDVGSQRSWGYVGRSGEGAKRDEDWDKLSIRAAMSKNQSTYMGFRTRGRSSVPLYGRYPSALILG
jgi:hypothetical protein